MRREGRQHGTVRTAGTKFIHKLDSAPTAGSFTKVCSKPTNHSKFTGKSSRPRCNSCHMNPCSKSKDKTKGAQKLRSCDVSSSSRLITWRVVVDRQPRSNFTGFSATGMLEHLEDEFEDDGFDHNEAEVGVEIEEDNGGEDDDDVMMSFCDVGFLLDNVEGDEGWCLVQEI